MLSPLARALPAMTALQATVALGMFALSVLAPQLGLSVPQLGALNTVLFTVGALTALGAGRLLARLGDWNVAALCAVAVAAGMVSLFVGGPLGPWIAALLFGLAFGPETPASASALSRLTPAARRPWVFSVRQTGNQIGAMAGSLLLPLLIVANPRLPYVVVSVIAMAMAAWCWWLSRDSRLGQGAAADSVAPVSTRAALRAVLGSRPLRALSFAALCYTAVQMCLNTFLMSLAVRDWQLDVTTASMWVAGLQAAGLGGRLFWGWLAQRSTGAARLLGGLGLLMAASGSVVMAWPGAHRGAGLALFVSLLGFSASGWNGVLVAEVSRLTGPRDAGALTGAVLMFGYAGLALSPLAFAELSVAVTMSTAFMGLFAATSIAGLVLLLDLR
jgi:MFS family permease